MTEPKADPNPVFSHGGTAPPFLYATDKNEIFADGTSPIEKLYALAFKDATAAGERTRGAHFKALKAVHRDGRNLGLGDRPTLRQRAGELLQQLGRRLAR